MTSGYWPSPWAGEDGDPSRQQRCASVALGVPSVTSRLAIASTMVVRRNLGEWYLLCHTGGDDAVSWVERFAPDTLDVLNRSSDLVAGPTWPGGIAVHANGDLYVVFGRYVHRLTPDLDVVGSLELPRDRPYNSFVILSDGTLVTKDFGGARPGEEAALESPNCELVAISPDLEVRERIELTEGSVARLSARDNDVVVVGTHSLFVVNWDGRRFEQRQRTPYRTEGEGYGWDAVIADDRAWFLNNGAGSHNFDGSLKGKGVAEASQSLVAVSLESDIDAPVQKFAVHDEPHSLVANPPAIDSTRGIAVGYDSGNGVVTAFRYNDPSAPPLWQRRQWHACHPLVMPDEGYVVMNDFNFATSCDEIVVVRIDDGEELSRVATESPLQSVLFGAPGDANDIYLCSFTHLTRVAWRDETLGY